MSSGVRDELDPDLRPEGDFGWTLGTVLRAYTAAAAAAIGDFPHGHRGYQLLSAVLRGTQPSQLALATHLGIDRTVMTYLIDDLVDKGLVERQQNPADRRSRIIAPTERGTAALREVDSKVHAAEDHVLRMLDDTERAGFRAMLRRVACDMETSNPGTDPCAAVIEALE